MEYCGFSICVKKHRSYDEIPVRKRDIDGSDTCFTQNTLMRRDIKQTLMTTTELEVHIEGYKVVDFAFAYELRVILEEFCAKRLSERKPGRAINAVIEPFGIEYGAISIERVDSKLVIKLVDHEATTELVSLDMVRAKTLHAILHKALYSADFQ